MRTWFRITPSDPDTERRARLDRVRSIVQERAGDSSLSGDLERLPAHELALQPGVHEWFASRDADRPPVGVLVDLARRASGRGSAPPGGRVLWIGPRVWAYPHALIERRPVGPGDRGLLERSVFVDATRCQERVWSIDLALRCAGVAIVIADASEMTMPESRRLQISAVSGARAALLVRPHREMRGLSAAATRWRTEPAPASGRDQSWKVHLLRCKGMRPAARGARRWIVRRDHETGLVNEWQACDVDMAPRVVDRSSAPARSQVA